MKKIILLMSACLLQACFLFSDDDGFDSGSEADISDKETAVKLALAFVEASGIEFPEPPAVNSRSSESEVETKQEPTGSSTSSSFNFICVEDSNDVIGSGRGSTESTTSSTETDTSSSFSSTESRTNSFVNCTASNNRKDMSSGNVYATYNGGGTRSFATSNSSSTTTEEANNEVQRESIRTSVKSISQDLSINRDVTIDYLVEEIQEPVQETSAPEERMVANEGTDLTYVINVNRTRTFDRTDSSTSSDMKPVQATTKSRAQPVAYSEFLQERTVLSVTNNVNDHKAEERINVTTTTDYNPDEEVFETSVNGSYGAFFENVIVDKETEMDSLAQDCPSGSVEVTTVEPLTFSNLEGDIESGQVTLSAGGDSISITYNMGEITVSHNDENVDSIEFIEYPEFCFPEAPDSDNLPKPRRDRQGPFPG